MDKILKTLAFKFILFWNLQIMFNLNQFIQRRIEVDLVQQV